MRAFCKSARSFTLSLTELSFMSTKPKRNIFLSSILLIKAGATSTPFSFAFAARSFSFLRSPVECQMNKKTIKQLTIVFMMYSSNCRSSNQSSFKLSNS